MKQWQTILIDLVVKGVSAWWNKRKNRQSQRRQTLTKRLNLWYNTPNSISTSVRAFALSSSLRTHHHAASGSLDKLYFNGRDACYEWIL
jgi:hypothetical protein